MADQVVQMLTTQLPNPDFFHFEWWVSQVTWNEPEIFVSSA